VSSFVPNDGLVVGGKGESTNGSSSNDLRSDRERRSSSTLDSGTSDDMDSIDGPGVIMLTGPNYSGKSVYLKQLALIVYMAHVGCFVPAEKAVVGITDKILTRVQTRESVSKVIFNIMCSNYFNV
jgi:DNA mismatch repair protein MSH5